MRWLSVVMGLYVAMTTGVLYTYVCNYCFLCILKFSLQHACLILFYLSNVRFHATAFVLLITGRCAFMPLSWHNMWTKTPEFLQIWCVPLLCLNVIAIDYL